MRIRAGLGAGRYVVPYLNGHLEIHAVEADTVAGTLVLGTGEPPPGDYVVLKGRVQLLDLRSLPQDATRYPAEWAVAMKSGCKEYTR